MFEDMELKYPAVFAELGWRIHSQPFNSPKTVSIAEHTPIKGYFVGLDPSRISLDEQQYIFNNVGAEHELTRGPNLQESQQLFWVTNALHFLKYHLH